MIQTILVGLFLISNPVFAQSNEPAADQNQSEYILLELEPVETEDSGARDAEQVKSRIFGGAGAAARDGATASREPEPGECSDCETCNPPCHLNGHYISGHFNYGAHLDFNDLVGGWQGRYEFHPKKAGGLELSLGKMNGKGAVIGRLSGWMPLKIVLDENSKTTLQPAIGGYLVDRNLSNMRVGGVGAGVALQSKNSNQGLRFLVHPVAFFQDRGLFFPRTGGQTRDVQGMITQVSCSGTLNAGKSDEDGTCLMQFQATIEGGVVHNLRAQANESDQDFSLHQDGAGAYLGVEIDFKRFLDQKRRIYILARFAVQNYWYNIQDVSLYPVRVIVNGSRSDWNETGMVQGNIGFGFRIKQKK